MKHFEPEKETVIQTDASKNGSGCYLMQNKHTVVYTSRALTETEIQYAQIEKELLAIVYHFKKFHYYTYGRNVLIQTYHNRENQHQVFSASYWNYLDMNTMLSIHQERHLRHTFKSIYKRSSRRWSWAEGNCTQYIKAISHYTSYKTYSSRKYW